MNDRLKLAGSVIGYSTWFVLLFVLLTWITFPWGRVRDHAVVAAADAGWALRMDSLGSAFVGVKARGVSLAQQPRGDETPPAPLVTLEKVKVKTGFGGASAAGLELRSIAAEGGVPVSELIQRVLGAVGEVSAKADLYGGDLDLTLEGGEEAARISWEAEKLDLARYVLQLEGFSAEPRGRLRSEADVTWHWDDPKKTSGSVDLVLDGLILAGTKVGFITLPETAFSRSEAHLKLSRGKAEFRDTVFEADEVQAKVEGFISLSKTFMRSRLSLRLRFKLREDLDGLTKMALGSDPSHKDGEGWYHYQVNGTLAKPRFRPSPAAARGGRRSSPPRNTVPTPDLGDDDDDDDLKPSRKDRRTTGARSGQKIEREPLSEDEQADREAARERLREERTQRREERRARREELMQRRRERQAQIDGDGSGVGTAFEIDEAIPRDNLQIGPDEGEGDEFEGEEGEEGEGEEPFEEDLEPLEFEE